MYIYTYSYSYYIYPIYIYVRIGNRSNFHQAHNSPSTKWSSRTEFLSLAQSAYQELKQMEGHVVPWRWVASPIVGTPGKRGEETLESQRDTHQKVRNTHTIMMRMRKTDWMCFFFLFVPGFILILCFLLLLVICLASCFIFMNWVKGHVTGGNNSR